MKILIVDDSRAMQTIVKRIVMQAGYDKAEFDYADNGSSALELLRGTHYDLTLLDWHMPGITGLEVLEKVKAEKLETCIGLITTERLPAKIDAAKRAGAKFIIHKPFTVDTLKEAVVPVLAGIDPDDEERPLVLPLPATLEKVLGALCGQTVHVVSEKPAQLNSDLTPFMLVLLHNNKDKLRAIMLLDQALLCALGGAFGQVATNVVTQAVGSKALPELLKQNAERVLRVLSASFFDPGSGADLNIKSAHLIDQNFGKLQSLYDKSGVERLDLCIELKGYGGGRIIICAEKK